MLMYALSSQLTSWQVQVENMKYSNAQAMSATVVVVDLHVAADNQASKPSRRRMLKRIALYIYMIWCILYAFA